MSCIHTLQDQQCPCKTDSDHDSRAQDGSLVAPMLGQKGMQIQPNKRTEGNKEGEK